MMCLLGGQYSAAMFSVFEQMRDFTGFSAVIKCVEHFSYYSSQTSDEKRLIPFDSKFNSSLAYTPFQFRKH